MEPLLLQCMCLLVLVRIALPFQIVRRNCYYDL